MTEVRFQELDIGQGSANFIEIYTNPTNKAPDATMLFDLGTERDPEHAASDETLRYIYNTLIKMIIPTINLIVLSHSDSDHINLINNLLDKFDHYPPPTGSTKPVLTVENAYFAGEYLKFKKRQRDNVLDTIAEYMPGTKTTEPFSTLFTSFNPTKTSPLYNFLDLNVFVLIANTITSTKTKTSPTPYEINTRSVVLLVTCGVKQFVVTGDATGRTIRETNNIISEMTPTDRATYLGDVFMTTAPHHGSATTTFDIQGLGKSAPDPATNLQTFSDFIKTKCLTASAERVQRFGHPAWSVLKGLSGHLEKHAFVDTSYPLPSGGTRTLHPVTVHLNPGNFPGCPWPATTEKDFYSFDTELNLFTNLYCLGPNYYNVTIPPEPGATYNPSAASALPYASIAMGVSWEFKVDSAGKTAVSKRDDRPWIPPKAVHQLAAAGTGAFLAHPRSVSLAASLKPAFPSYAARLTGLRQLG